MTKKIMWFVRGILAFYVVVVTYGWWKMLTDADWADRYRDACLRH